MGDIDFKVDIDLKQKNKNIGKQIAEDIAKGVRDTLVSFGVVSEGEGKEKKGGLSSAAVMGAVAGGVMKLVDFVGGIVADWPPIVAAMKILKAIILTLLMPLVPILRPVLLLLALLARTLMKIFGPAKTQGGKDTQVAMSGAGAIAGGVIGGMAGGPVGAAIGVAAGAAVGGFIGNLQEALDNFDWSQLDTYVANFLVKAVTWLGDAFKFFYEGFVVPLIGLLGSVFGFIYEGVMAFLSEWWGTLKDVGVWIWEKIIKPGFEILSDVGQWIWDEILKPAWDFLSNVGQTIWDTILQPAWDFLSGVGEKIWTEVLKPAFDWLSDVGTKIWDIIKDPFTQLAGKLADIFKWIKTTVRSLIGGGSVNDGIVQNGKIITTHPDDYIVATKDPSSLGGGRGITININNPVVRDDRDIDTLVKKISMELQKSYRGRVSYV